MRKKNPPFVLFLFFSVAFILSSCTDQGGEGSLNCFKTKNDSIDFAKAVMSRYPGELPKDASFTRPISTKVSADKIDPIEFNRLLMYAKYYDRAPIIKKTRGFFIDERGMSMLKNVKYKHLYLRFGKYTDDPKKSDDYTIMLIPLNADSTLVHRGPANTRESENNNYDYLDPCPEFCPKDSIL
jgi:hypothetical protein